MRLKVLGSSSSGNCYLLENEEECLVIEAGVPFREVKIELDFDIGKIVGVIVSHGHVDHGRYAKEYKSAGIPVYQQYIPVCGNPPNKRFGKFTVRAFENRDSNERWLHGNSDGSECPCYGFLITHPEFGKLVFATDTEYIKYKFKNVNHIMVEANYLEKYIDREDAKLKHVLEGHLSIKTCCEFLKANKSDSLKNVILLHMSNGSSNEDEFVDMAQAVVGDGVSVYAADKGLEVQL